MLCNSKFRKIVWMVIVVFAFTGTVQAYDAARIMTEGKINVYRNGQLSQVLRQNAPLPADAMLKPEGNCGVRLENLLLVAKDGSEFGVHNESLPVQLALKGGTIYFAVNQSSGQMIFNTPAGSVTTQQFQIHASAGGTLKGFVDVTEGTTTLGVLEGGAMVVSTPNNGEQVITSGNQIVLAQADILKTYFDKTEKAPEPDKKKISTETLLTVGALALFGGGMYWAIDSSSDNDSKTPVPVSPATP